MPEFEFDSHRVTYQKLRYTVDAESKSEAYRLIAAGQVEALATGPAVLLHAGELEPAQPIWVPTYDAAGCPVWEPLKQHIPAS